MIKSIILYSIYRQAASAAKRDSTTQYSRPNSINVHLYLHYNYECMCVSNCAQ